MMNKNYCGMTEKESGKRTGINTVKRTSNSSTSGSNGQLNIAGPYKVPTLINLYLQILV